MNAEQHHEDCDYRNSTAAVETDERHGVPEGEQANEVHSCNLGCEARAVEEMAKRIVADYTTFPVWREGKPTDEVRVSYDPVYFDRGYSHTDEEAMSGFISGEADEHGFQYWRERAYDQLDEWVSESIHFDAWELVKSHQDDIEAAGLDETDVQDEVRQALHEAITQDYAAEWIKNMAPPRVRVQVDGFGGETEHMDIETDTPESILATAGIEATEKNLEAAACIMREAWHSRGYYNLWLVFRMDTTDVPEGPANMVRIQGECELWAGNPYAGDGMAETVEVDVTIERALLTTDGQAMGYAYDSVFGPYWPAIGQPKLTFFQREEAPAENPSA